MENSQLLSGIFLLLIAVSHSFADGTLGCKTQLILQNNIYAKHLLIIFILYFSTEFMDDEDTTHPIDNLFHALQIWVLFVLFTKMTVPFTIVTFIFICLIFISKQFIHYYKTIGNIDDISKIGMIEYITSILTNVTICTLVLGFIIYLHKQYKSHRSNFSILKFIFGSIKCDSMK